jgi:hypothetical protein
MNTEPQTITLGDLLSDLREAGLHAELHIASARVTNMKLNNHIIVGEPRRCLCGVYEVNGARIPVGCSNIIEALEKAASADPETGVALAAIRECFVDCSEPEASIAQ